MIYNTLTIQEIIDLHNSTGMTVVISDGQIVDVEV